MSTFQVGKIMIGPPKSSNLVDQMSGKFQILDWTKIISTFCVFN